MEQEHILPVVLDLLRTNNDLELRSLTGFLRNLSRHARDKNDMGQSLTSFMENMPARIRRRFIRIVLFFVKYKDQ